MSNMENNSLSRQEIEWKIIYPALLRAGWEEKQIQYRKRFSNGLSYMKVDNEPLLTFVEAKQPTFTLRYWDNLPLAIIRHAESGESLSNALENIRPWADGDNGGLDLQCVYTTDGYQFLEWDVCTNSRRWIKPSQFPAPHDLWGRYLYARGLSHAQGHKLTAYWHYCQERQPKHFEVIAFNRTIEALVKGHPSVVLIIGALFSIHFLIPKLIGHLWEIRFAKRFLYLAEKDPAKKPQLRNHFKGFDPVIACPNEPWEEQEYRPLVIWAWPGGETGPMTLLGAFEADFFDIVIIDEIHRDFESGDADWQACLKRFPGAIHVGMTNLDLAPVYTSNFHHFGKMIYRYSEDQAEADGNYYLSPFHEKQLLQNCLPPYPRAEAVGGHTSVRALV